MKKITVFTDGACKGNPGKGGYGSILLYGQHRRELSGGFKKTTNNRMELLAVIVALETLKEACEVTVYSDSKYVVDSITKKWLDGWVKKNFKDKKNPDLWKRYLEAAKIHQVSLQWVKGHAGNPLNERCDYLAVEAAESKDLTEDIGFKK